MCVSEGYLPSSNYVKMFTLLWNPSKIISHIVLVFEGIKAIEATSPFELLLTFWNTQNGIILLSSYLITNVFLRLQLTSLMVVMGHRFIHRVLLP